ncbi:MAG: YybH family protein [Alphaproteobacteria bacterium]
MIKSVAALAALVTVMFIQPAFADDADDAAAIVQIYADWRAAVEGADIKSYVSVLDEDVRLMPPGAADFVGRDSYEAFLQPVFDNATYQISPISAIDVEVQGDWAFARYDYEVRVEMKEGSTEIGQEGALTDNVNRSKYFDVLRRQDDGSWKVYRHTWNAMPPS